jgi:multiple sugar transport system permease protein
MRMRTLEVGLSIFKNSYGATNWPLQMAAAVVTLAPMVIVFLLAQRWFVRGIQMSGLK